MKMIERYSFNGCAAAGGPWEDTIATDVAANDVVSFAKEWCKEIQKRVSEMNPPRSIDEWRFTTKPQYIQQPCGIFDIAVKTIDNWWFITKFYGEGETYTLICEK